jgi:hypothetical protein
LISGVNFFISESPASLAEAVEIKEKITPKTIYLSAFFIAVSFIKPLNFSASICAPAWQRDVPLQKPCFHRQHILCTHY